MEKIIQLTKGKWILPIGCIVAVICIITAGMLLGSAAEEKRLTEQLEMGEKYLAELDYEAAIVAYELAIRIDPKCEEAYIQLATAYLATGQRDKAIEVLEKGVELISSEELRTYLQRVLSHEWQPATCDRPKTCVLCGETEGRPLEHKWQEATYEKPKTCEMCGMTEGEPLKDIPEKVVDGMVHHSYTKCAFSENQEKYLKAIIECAEAGKYDEAIQMLDDDIFCELISDVCYMKYDEERTFGRAYVVFDEYKIMMEYPSLIRKKIYLLPVDEGMGFYFRLGGTEVWHLASGERLETNIVKEYAVCECKDGMYNGNATCRYWAEYQDGEFGEFCSVNEQTGEISNGVRNGKWYTSNSSSLSSVRTSYSMSVYEKGILQVLGQDEAWVWLDLYCDENGNPIKMSNGDYIGTCRTRDDTTYGLNKEVIVDGYRLPY